MSARSAILFAAVGLVALVFALLLLEGCRAFESEVPREAARAAVLTTSEGVRLASDACAAHALATKDLELARRCARAYDAARLSLVATAAGVDAWERADRDSITCAVRTASAELELLTRELEAKGGRVPPIVADSFRLVSALAPCIPDPTPYPGGAR